MHTTDIKLNVIPFKDNPRKITDVQKRFLSDSLRRFGDISGITINLRSGQVVGGNQRLESFGLFRDALTVSIFHEYEEMQIDGTMSWGFITADDRMYMVRLVDWDEATERAANLAANKAGGEWDFLVLATAWDIPELKAGGFDNIEIKSIFPELREKQAVEIEPIYALEIRFENESELQNMYEELRGKYSCKILTF